MLTALSVIVAVAVLPMVVLATDTFSDVPDGGFHDAINNLYNAGIASGCATTPTLKYCPGSAVTRGQMAAFLNRGLGRAARNETNITELADAQDTDLASVTIDTGGVSGRDGFVLVTGSVSASTPSATTCPCQISVRVRDETSTLDAPGSQSFDVSNTASPSGNRSASGSMSWVFAVDSGTTYTFTVRADVDMTGAVGILQLQGVVTAMYVPFGSTGGSTP